ncbi:MAG: hypothetical protein R3B95_01665 [Nitrospirales bacterium]|nr:hypothetical protein [Nitrospirales bacterium]
MHTLRITFTNFFVMALLLIGIFETSNGLAKECTPSKASVGEIAEARERLFWENFSPFPLDKQYSKAQSTPTPWENDQNFSSNRRALAFLEYDDPHAVECQVICSRNPVTDECQCFKIC